MTSKLVAERVTPCERGRDRPGGPAGPCAADGRRARERVGGGVVGCAPAECAGSFPVGGRAGRAVCLG